MERMKILIAEDEAYSRQSLQKQVLEAGEGAFDVLTAENGRQAWEIFERERPELVLSDVKMPALGGLDLLRLIRQSSPETMVVMISGYAEFKYAQQAVNLGAAGYLLKPVADQELRETLGRFLRRSEEKKRTEDELTLLKDSDVLTQYIDCHLRQENAPEDFVGDTVFGNLFDLYVLACVYLPGGQPDRVAFCRELGRVFESEVWGEFRLVVLRRGLWAIVARVTGGLSTALRRVESYLGKQELRFFIGVSAQHDSISALRTAYRQAMLALESRMFFQSGRLLCYEEIARERGERTVPDEELIEIMRLHMMRGDAANAYAAAEKMVLKVLQNPRSSVEAVEWLLGSVQNVLRETRFTVEFDVLAYDTAGDLLADVRRGITEICDSVRKAREATGDEVVNTVLDYINRNYNKELSLRDLAENVFYLNPSYLSHLISEKTGRSYSHYLKEVRIEKSKELLGNPDLSITQVASLIGYNDTSQFIQTFKKEVGMTPRKFRDML